MSGPGRADRAMPALNPTRAWWGLVFIALGGLAVLHVTGIVDWNQTVDHWWPVAIIGWALAEMLTARRFSATAAIIAAAALGLLAGEQHWTGRGILWSVAFAGHGVKVTTAAGRWPRARPAKPAPRPAAHVWQAQPRPPAPAVTSSR